MGTLTLKNDVVVKSINNSRVTVLDGHTNAKNIANKCISLFQLNEAGQYDYIKDKVYNYLSEDLQSLYFPGNKIKGVLPKSKITIHNTVSEKIGDGDYLVKVDFTKVGATVKDHRIIVGITKGKIYSMETIK